MTDHLLFSDEAEQGVIGGLLLDPRAADHLGDELKPAHFYRDDHRRIFAAIQRLSLANKPFDVAAVYAELEESGEVQQCGGVGYMAEIADNTPSAANIRRYAEIVIERALACSESPVQLETIKIIALMVLWSQEAEVDRLILEELLRHDGEHLTH